MDTQTHIGHARREVRGDWTLDYDAAADGEPTGESAVVLTLGADEVDSSSGRRGFKVQEDLGKEVNPDLLLGSGDIIRMTTDMSHFQPASSQYQGSRSPICLKPVSRATERSENREGEVALVKRPKYWLASLSEWEVVLQWRRQGRSRDSSGQDVEDEGG
ncbi:hypothetical protein PIB30_002411 [Stylosanthes scabra]|uniref:Uncharacterized protein n=1 Tax=Stylosanthes scabra TaxID=79078 RepID=A0ABU6W2G3_9FABA|nr:hypothetical protein [Stylosanthes scabra]